MRKSLWPITIHTLGVCGVVRRPASDRVVADLTRRKSTKLPRPAVFRAEMVRGPRDGRRRHIDGMRVVSSTKFGKTSCDYSSRTFCPGATSGKLISKLFIRFRICITGNSGSLEHPTNVPTMSAA